MLQSQAITNFVTKQIIIDDNFTYIAMTDIIQRQRYYLLSRAIKLNYMMIYWPIQLYD